MVNAKSLKPIDEAMLHKCFKISKDILIVEQVVSSGSLYDRILEFKEENNYTSKIHFHGFKPGIEITHGSLDEVYKHYKLSNEELLKKINSIFKK